MYLKNRSIKRLSILALSAGVLLSVNAEALFGAEKADAQPEEGAPVAQELSISTYRGIPYEAQLLGSGRRRGRSDLCCCGRAQEGHCGDRRRQLHLYAGGKCHRAPTVSPMRSRTAPGMCPSLPRFP